MVEITLLPNAERTHSATPAVITKSETNSNTCCHKNPITRDFKSTLTAASLIYLNQTFYTAKLRNFLRLLNLHLRISTPHINMSTYVKLHKNISIGVVRLISFRYQYMLIDILLLFNFILTLWNNIKSKL